MNKIKEIFNFDNVGGKIKSLAKWYCWISVLLVWIIAPIAFIGLVSDGDTVYFCWIPIVAAVVIPFLVWIESWFLYAFGEFVEDVHAIRNKHQSQVYTDTEVIGNNQQNHDYTDNITSHTFVTVNEENELKLDSFEILDSKNKSDWIDAKQANYSFVGKCEMCGTKKQELVNIEFTDFFGTARRSMCYTCFCKYNNSK